MYFIGLFIPRRLIASLFMLLGSFYLWTYSLISQLFSNLLCNPSVFRQWVGVSLLLSILYFVYFFTAQPVGVAGEQALPIPLEI